MPRRLLAAVVAVAVCTFVSCTDDGTPTPDRSATPGSGVAPAPVTPCPRFRGPKRVGTVGDASLDEISGVAASERAGVLWVHEDSGAPPVIYAIKPTGQIVATVEIEGAESTDWEDIALAKGTIWIGDIGDNAGARVNGIQVYWLREPEPRSGTVRARELTLTYPDGPHDAEALFVDADHDALYVITKELSFTSGDVYRASIDGIHDGDLRELERTGSVPIGTVTAADVSPLGVIVKNYGQARLFPWQGDDTVERALQGSGCSVPIGGGESVTYRRADRSIYAIPEGGSPPVWVSAPA